MGKNYVLRDYSYPAMTKTQTKGTAKFILHVEEGQFTDSEIIVLLGENGTGKTTFFVCDIHRGGGGRERHGYVRANI